jgi:hypothetical protein
MRRRGFATLVFIIIVAVVIAIAAAVWIYGSLHSKPQLSDADVSNLVIFLQQNGVQAAVIQKFDPPNSASTWLVKSDGEKIFLYSKNLGECPTEWWPLDAWENDIVADKAVAVAILPDQAEVFDLALRKYFDITPYLKGYSINPSWRSIFTTNKNGSGSYCAGGPSAAAGGLSDFGKVLSPDGHYLAMSTTTQTGSYASSGTEFFSAITAISQIQLSSSSYYLTTSPLSFKDFEFLAWSTDSSYILLANPNNYPDYTKDIAIYDVKNATTSYYKVNSAVIFNADFEIFIYPSTILYENSSWPNSEIGGTFSVNFDNKSAQPINILPNQIKMVGLIQ